MTGITLTVDDKDILAAVDKLAKLSGDLSPAMADIAGYGVTSTQQRFEAEAGPDGTPWTPFARSTLRSMPARRRANPKLLRDRVSPGLYSSVTGYSDEASAEWGSNLAYAAIHQLSGTVNVPEQTREMTFVTVKQGAGKAKNEDGTFRRVGSKLRFAKASSRAKTRETKTVTIPAHQVHIPARPYLGISEPDKAEILAILERHYALAAGGGAP